MRGGVCGLRPCRWRRLDCRESEAGISPLALLLPTVNSLSNLLLPPSTRAQHGIPQEGPPQGPSWQPLSLVDTVPQPSSRPGCGLWRAVADDPRPGRSTCSFSLGHHSRRQWVRALPDSLLDGTISLPGQHRPLTLDPCLCSFSPASAEPPLRRHLASLRLASLPPASKPSPPPLIRSSFIRYSVGKTSLMNQYVNKRFSNQYKATIGADL